MDTQPDGLRALVGSSLPIGEARTASQPTFSLEQSGHESTPAAISTAARTVAPGSVQTPSPSGRDVAVIAMSGRFPHAADVDEFWANLQSGRDCITEIPRDRWSLDGFFSSDPNVAVTAGQSYCKWGGFLDGVDQFDPRSWHAGGQ